MRALRLISPTLFVLALTAAAAAESPDAASLPVSSFFGLPEVVQPRLSPDGSKIAFLFPHNGRLALGLFDRSTNQARMIIEGKDESLVGFFWKGNERIVFYADFRGNESFFVASTDLTGKRVIRIVETQPSEYLTGSAGGILDALPLSSDYIAVQGYIRTDFDRGLSGRSELLFSADYVVTRINVHNRGESTQYVYHRSDRTWDVVVDNSGTVRLRSRRLLSRERADLVWEHRKDAGNPWREVARHPDHGYAPDWNPVGFDADNRTLWIISREDHDRGALIALDTESLAPPKLLFAPTEGEITQVIRSQDRKRLLGVRYETDRIKYHWFDPERAGIQRRLEGSFPGFDVRITSSSDDESTHLVWVGSDREPGTYFVLDTKAGSMATFKRVRTIDSQAMSPMKPIMFEARDGLQIHGFLTLPAGIDAAHPGPLVLLVHGGPFGIRDSWGFESEVQFLANRGYAVLQVNFRGSGGYGREFMDKGRCQWGRAMQDDLTDAVGWVIQEGYADPARVAIMGASYGGYAALAGVTLTPELYACAVNYVGASDLEITFKDRGDDAYMDALDTLHSYQTLWVGPNKEYRAATSPVNLVERIRVPTLHAYGLKDPRVKIDHWTRLEAELKRHKKDYTSVQERRQGHGFRDQRASVSFYEEVDRFLAKHLGK